MVYVFPTMKPLTPALVVVTLLAAGCTPRVPFPDVYKEQSMGPNTYLQDYQTAFSRLLARTRVGDPYSAFLRDKPFGVVLVSAFDAGTYHSRTFDYGGRGDSWLVTVCYEADTIVAIDRGEVASRSLQE